MSDLKDLFEKIDALKDAINEKPKPMAWIKDVFIPVTGLLLAVMGFVANSDANKRQEREAQSIREQKYLEYFLENYADTSSVKQASAFALLKYMKPEVRNDLVFALSANTDLSKDAWRVLVGIEDVRLNFAAADSFRVEIYYAKENKSSARQIDFQLKQSGFKGQVTLKEREPQFWDEFGWGEGNEIRFEPNTESIAMKYLYRFIDAKNPSLELRKAPVTDTSRPKSVAIHLPPVLTAVPLAEVQRALINQWSNVGK